MIAPGDGPAQVLDLLSRRFALGYSRTFVVERVMAHRSPGSLAAMVEVGAELGLAFAPKKCAPTVLDALAPNDLPVVVHLGDGFGVILAIEDDRVTLWDSIAGAREVARGEVAAAWTGVLVLVERGEPGVRERSAWRNKLGEAVFLDWQPRLELAGARGSRWLGGALIGAAALLALVGAGASPIGAAPFVLAIAALIGVLASVGMTRLGGGGLAAKMCGGKRLDCESVLTSVYARVAGVPVSTIALAFSGASLLVMATAALASPARAAACAWLVAWASVAALPAVVFFVRAQVRLRAMCTLCAMAHAAIVVGAIAAIAELRGLPPVRDAVVAAALFAIFFGAIAAAVAPFVHRVDDADRDAVRLARLLAQPAVTLTELFAGEAPAELDDDLAIAIGDPDAPMEVTAFIHPSCPACGVTLGELARLLATRPDRIRARLVIAAGHRGDPVADRLLRGALYALGRELPGPAFFGLVRQLKGAAQAAVDPLGALGGLVALDRAALATLAEGEVARADRAAEVARGFGGVPTVLVAGRLMRAPLEHVLAWCDVLSLSAGLPEAG